MKRLLHTLPIRYWTRFIVILILNLQQIQSNALDTSNHALAPLIPSGQELEIMESSPTGTSVGTVTATDNQAITNFKITSAEALSTGTPRNDSPINALAMFAINNNGEISVNDPTYLLATVGPVNLTVEVTNMQGMKASAIVKIKIKDTIISTSGSQGLSWKTGTPQPLGNSEGQSEVVNGKMYSFSGFDITKKPAYTPADRAYVFDPEVNTWTLLNLMPKMHPNAAHGGVTHAGFTTDGKDIFFGGGYPANANGNGQLFGTRYVYKYVVASDTYQRLPNLPIERAAGALEYLDNKLYYIGGVNLARNEDQGDVLVLDLNNLNAGWRYLSSSPLPNPRNHIGSAVLDGKIYIVGGQHEQDGKLTTQDDVHAFDPTTAKWTKVTDLPDIDEVPDGLTPGKGHITNSTFTYNGQLFVLGGEYQFLGPYSKSVLAYDPVSNVWTSYSSMPTVRSSGIAGVINGTLYYSTGRNSKTTYQAEIGTPPPATEIALEGECGAVGNNWKTVSDPTASGGSYVVMPNLNSYSVPADVPANRVRFAFSLDSPGDYHLFARVRAPSGNADSFWFRVNGGSWVQWWKGITTGNSFNWNEAISSPVSLNQGNNIIDFAYRENGTQLDKLQLNLSGQSPSGLGGEAANCGGNPPNGAPVASATANPISGTAPLKVNFDANASTDDKGIVSYLWDFGDGNTSSSAKTTHTYTEAGEYIAILTVKDAEGLEDETSFNILVEEAPNTFASIRLNAGGNALTMNGDEFVADNSTNPIYYNSQHTYTNNALNAPALYKSERGSETNGGSFTYQVPVPDGSYTVRTHHAELYYGFNGRTARAGRRVFDIAIEGQTVQDNLDLYVEGVGINKNYLVLTFNDIQVTDGMLTIHMDASVNRPTVSGIEILGGGASLQEEVTFANNEVLRQETEQKESTSNLFTVFPNAMKDNHRINLQSSQELSSGYNFVLTDNSGRTIDMQPSVSRTSPSVIMLDLSAKPLRQGIYYLHVQDEAQQTRQVIRFLKE